MSESYKATCLQQMTAQLLMFTSDHAPICEQHLTPDSNVIMHNDGMHNCNMHNGGMHNGQLQLCMHNGQLCMHIDQLCMHNGSMHVGSIYA